MLWAYLANPSFPEEGVSAIFTLTNRLSNFSINKISVACGQNGLPGVSLGWTSPGLVTSYQVQRKLSSSSVWTILGATDQTTMTDLAWQKNYPVGTYQYRVVASNSTRSSTSKTASIKVPACTSPAPAPAPAPAPTSSPATILWGAYTGGVTADITNFESQVGKKMNIVAVFVDFAADSFPAEFKTAVADQGKTLLVFWEPYHATLDDINAGKYDTYIRNFAAAAKTYSGPIILAPLHEANGDWTPWGGTVGSNTPAKVISAWKKIHDLFAGAANVKFGWAVNNDSVPDTAGNQIANYWPGDAYVDYVGVDGFNFGDPWQTFSEVFDSSLAKLKTYNKPIYIFSFACAQGTAKAAWITDALAVQIPKNAQIAGWVWFNENKEMDWRVWSDSSALAAFRNALP
jgi:hypothetical protein